MYQYTVQSIKDRNKRDRLKFVDGQGIWGVLMKLSLLLFGLSWLLRLTALRHAAFRARLKEKNFTAQMKTMDGSSGRYFTFKDGKISSGSGLHPNPDMWIGFKSAALGADLLTPPIDYQNQIDAIKNFNLLMEGPDELTSWFSETVLMSQTIGWKFGTQIDNGETR